MKFLFISLLLFSLHVNAVTTCSLTASTNWTVASSWSCGHVPLNTDNIFIPETFTVTITTSIDLSGGNLTDMTIAGTLFFSGNNSILKLPTTATVNLLSTGNITTDVNNASQKFKIGTNSIWESNSGTVTGPSTATSSSGALPIELLDFYVFYVLSNHFNTLKWFCVTELNNEFFIVERSIDGVEFIVIAKLDGAGNSSAPTSYYFNDNTFDNTLNYYRLKQVDFNGTFIYHYTISIDNSLNNSELTVLKRINTLGQEINEDYEGVYIEIYNNGTAKRKCCNIIIKQQ